MYYIQYESVYNLTLYIYILIHIEIRIYIPSIKIMKYLKTHKWK